MEVSKVRSKEGGKYDPKKLRMKADAIKKKYTRQDIK